MIRFVNSVRLASLVAVAVAALLSPSASAALTDYTWSGRGTFLSVNGDLWSNGANWVGGSAPSGPVGTLTFPRLTSSACAGAQPVLSCYYNHNDLSGLSATAISIDSTSPYVLAGNGIVLGAGGIHAAPLPPAVRVHRRS